MNKSKLFLTLLTVLALCLVLAGCGSDDNSGTAAGPAQDADFLLGSWFAEEATYEGQPQDPDEVFGATFSLYFSDDGKCTMWVGQDRALVDWELTENGVTLRGDGTYPAVFQDESKKTMVITINGVDVLMEKYEE